HFISIFFLLGIGLSLISLQLISWLNRKNKKEKEKFSKVFQEILNQGKGEINLTLFMRRTNSSLVKAKKYLDLQATEFKGICSVYVNQRGSIYYQFKTFNSLELSKKIQSQRLKKYTSVPSAARGSTEQANKEESAA
ncbi:MAG: hypothetical protein QNJ38_24955, partial [Prochloraceae cyanobacterium]|nr:hypothetical protein [Prochloraceae cyanobacterium]